MSPKVFVSYAGEDKDRFVEGFATKLRSKGIEPWLAFWELSPGDSLVDKIFEEGLKDAEAVVVIISKNSINKPWVREELNAGMVKKINEGSRLIPVLLDGCEVPECLKATVWVKIEDLSNYDTEVDQIVDSIFERHNKPPVGNPPEYTKSSIDSIPGLTTIDSLLLKSACEIMIQNDSCRIDTEVLLEKTESYEVPPVEFFDSLRVLHERDYFRVTWLARESKIEGYHIGHLTKTLFGFEQYCKVFINDYETVRESVAFQIVNQDCREEPLIIAALGQPRLLVRHILETLEKKRLIGFRDLLGRGIVINDISPELKRRLNRA